MKNKIWLLLAGFLIVSGLPAQKPQDTPQLYQSGGIYYRDRAQTELYTGDYREYYDNNTVRLEMQIKDGLPEGPYIVYFENRKPKEIRSYKDWVFSLRGKPLNSYGLTKKIVYENEEFNLLQAALDIEDDMDNLRYNKIVIATDADVDGMHIRLLLLTFFLQFFPDLIKRGHVFVLQTPLFRVRNKKQTFYCYSDEERRKAIAALGKSPEITRFKGLGEISPDEFKNFIGEDIRLDPVVMSKDASIEMILSYYMGKNTPERQEFIIDNLRVEDDSEEALVGEATNNKKENEVA